MKIMIGNIIGVKKFNLKVSSRPHVPLVELAHSTGTDLKMWYIKGVEGAGVPVSPESHCLFELR